jgi:hypothetical protein
MFLLAKIFHRRRKSYNLSTCSSSSSSSSDFLDKSNDSSGKRLYFATINIYKQNF